MKIDRLGSKQRTAPDNMVRRLMYDVPGHRWSTRLSFDKCQNYRQAKTAAILSERRRANAL